MKRFIDKGLLWVMAICCLMLSNGLLAQPCQYAVDDDTGGDITVMSWQPNNDPATTQGYYLFTEGGAFVAYSESAADVSTGEVFSVMPGSYVAFAVNYVTADFMPGGTPGTPFTDFSFGEIDAMANMISGPPCVSLTDGYLFTVCPNSALNLQTCNDGSTDPIVIKQVVPGSYNHDVTNTQIYIAYDMAGNYVASSTDGVFTGLPDGTYNVYAVNYVNADLTAANIDITTLSLSEVQDLDANSATGPCVDITTAFYEVVVEDCTAPTGCDELCDYVEGDIFVETTGFATNPAYTQAYILADNNNNILSTMASAADVSAGATFAGVTAGYYYVYAVNYVTADFEPGGTPGMSLSNYSIAELMAFSQATDNGLNPPCVNVTSQCIRVCEPQACATVDAGTVESMTACDQAGGVNPTMVTFTSTGDAGGTWSIDGGASISASGSVDATGLTSGNYTVTYTVVNPDLPDGTVCDDASATATLTVNDCTPPEECGTVHSGTVSNMTACDQAGGDFATSVTFTSTGDAGGAWSIDGGASISASGVVDATGLTPGTYTVTYTVVNPDLSDGTVCPDASSTGTLTVEDCSPVEQCGTVDAGSVSSIAVCDQAGGLNSTTATFTSDGDAGGTWSIDGGASISASGVVDGTGLTPGNYTVTYTVINPGLSDGTVCDDASTTATLTVLDCTPPEECGTVDAGNVLDLAACDQAGGTNSTVVTFTSTGDAGGTWSIGGGASISSNGTVDATGLTPGTYTVTYTVINPDLSDGTVCDDASTTATLTVLDCTPPPTCGTVDAGTVANIVLCNDVFGDNPTNGQFTSTGDAGGTWTISGGATIDANGNVSAVGLAAGSYPVTYTVVNPDLSDGTVCEDDMAMGTLIVQNCPETCGTVNAGTVSDITLCNVIGGVNPNMGQFASLAGDLGGTWSITGGLTIGANGEVDATDAISGVYIVTYTVVNPDLSDGTPCADDSASATLTITDCEVITCINPTATFTTECQADGTFSVTVNISDIGNSPDVLIFDNQGMIPQVADAPGAYTFSGYQSGSSVQMTVAGSLLADCFITSDELSETCTPPVPCDLELVIIEECNQDTGITTFGFIVEGTSATIVEVTGAFNGTVIVGEYVPLTLVDGDIWELTVSSNGETCDVESGQIFCTMDNTCDYSIEIFDDCNTATGEYILGFIVNSDSYNTAEVTGSFNSEVGIGEVNALTLVDGDVWTLTVSHEGEECVTESGTVDCVKDGDCDLSIEILEECNEITGISAISFIVNGTSASIADVSGAYNGTVNIGEPTFIGNFADGDSYSLAVSSEGEVCDEVTNTVDCVKPGDCDLEITILEECDEVAGISAISFVVNGSSAVTADVSGAFNGTVNVGEATLIGNFADGDSYSLAVSSEGEVCDEVTNIVSCIKDACDLEITILEDCDEVAGVSSVSFMVNGTSAATADVSGAFNGTVNVGEAYLIGDIVDGETYSLAVSVDGAVCDEVSNTVDCVKPGCDLDLVLTEECDETTGVFTLGFTVESETVATATVSGTFEGVVNTNEFIPVGSLVNGETYSFTVSSNGQECTTVTGSVECVKAGECETPIEITATAECTDDNNGTYNVTFSVTGGTGTYSITGSYEGSVSEGEEVVFGPILVDENFTLVATDDDPDQACEAAIFDGGIDDDCFIPGSIGDTVWFDENGNGIQDDGETGIAGVTVTLIDADGNETTTTTDANGNYLFDDLADGDYTVVVGDGPDGTYLTTSGTDTVSLGVGENYVDADFGFAPTGSISDTVWCDTNGNGVQDEGEEGLGGIIITLTLPDGSEITTTTDDNGNYIFDGLEAGDYTVTISGLPDDKVLTTPSTFEVALGAGENYVDADFGLMPICVEEIAISVVTICDEAGTANYYAEFTVSGGSGTYNISGSYEGTVTAGTYTTDLIANEGTYSLVVTDADPESVCEAVEAEGTNDEPCEVDCQDFDISVVEASCNLDGSYTIELVVNGGTGNYGVAGTVNEDDLVAGESYTFGPFENGSTFEIVATDAFHAECQADFASEFECPEPECLPFAEIVISCPLPESEDDTYTIMYDVNEELVFFPLTVTGDVETTIETVDDLPFFAVYEVGSEYSVTIVDAAGCDTTITGLEECIPPTAIELLEFDGEVQEHGNYLFWTTATEIDNDYFTLQRSFDGLNFETIATVDGAGNSNYPIGYSYMDEDYRTGNHYYRLLETDFNGETNIASQVVVLNRETSIMDVTITPIPAIDNLNINFTSMVDEYIMLQVYNVEGKVVEVLKVSTENGLNTYNLPISAYVPGTYMLVLISGDDMLTTKFIKD